MYSFFFSSNIFAPHPLILADTFARHAPHPSRNTSPPQIVPGILFSPERFRPHTLFFWQTACISHCLPNIRCARYSFFFPSTHFRDTHRPLPLSLSLSLSSHTLSLSLSLSPSLSPCLSLCHSPRGSSAPSSSAPSNLEKPVQLLDFLVSATPPPSLARW